MKNTIPIHLPERTTTYLAGEYGCYNTAFITAINAYPLESSTGTLSEIASTIDTPATGEYDLCAHLIDGAPAGECLLTLRPSDVPEGARFDLATLVQRTLTELALAATHSSTVEGVITATECLNRAVHALLLKEDFPQEGARRCQAN